MQQITESVNPSARQSVNQGFTVRLINTSALVFPSRMTSDVLNNQHAVVYHKSIDQLVNQAKFNLTSHHK